MNAFNLFVQFEINSSNDVTNKCYANNNAKMPNKPVPCNESNGFAAVCTNH